MIKEIVVQLTGSDEDTIRLKYAEQVASIFDAHVTGLQVHLLPDVLAITDPAGSAFLQEMLAESDKRAGELGKELQAKLGTLGVQTELRRFDSYPDGAGSALAAMARVSDLFIGTRPYGDPTGKQYLEEAVLFRSGRGCLFVPPHNAPPKAFETIIVAWNESREAARAVAEALPFLQKAKQVIVAIIESEGASEQSGVESGADIGRYLSRHGISAEVRKIGGWSDAGEALLNEAKKTGADMLVMGGYGHSRFREWVLGGATRYVLGEATIPVLMAH